MDKSSQAVSVFDKRAHDYQLKYMDVGTYHDTLDVLLAVLTKNSRILEPACGPGNITRYLLGKRPDLKIFGSDLSPNMVAIAKTNNPEAAFGLMDMRDTCKIDEKYDAVICGFGLPYLSKEEAIAFIHGLPGVLNPGGLVYLSTMEGNYANSRLQQSSDGKDEIFIHYHETGYLTKALADAGFEITLQKKQAFPLNTDTDLILIARHAG